MIAAGQSAVQVSYRRSLNATDSKLTVPLLIASGGASGSRMDREVQGHPLLVLD